MRAFLAKASNEFRRLNAGRSRGIGRLRLQFAAALCRNSRACVRSPEHRNMWKIGRPRIESRVCTVCPSRVCLEGADPVSVLACNSEISWSHRRWRCRFLPVWKISIDCLPVVARGANDMLFDVDDSDVSVFPPHLSDPSNHPWDPIYEGAPAAFP